MTMSLFTLMSALASSMVAPAALQIAEDLGITATVEVSMTLSIYVLAYGEHRIPYSASLKELVVLNKAWDSCGTTLPRSVE